jgi:predicted glycogen debranching enzyme
VAKKGFLAGTGNSGGRVPTDRVTREAFVETARDICGMAAGDLSKLTSSEWLIANGLGGYASSTIPCLNTRKYHGLLVAAMTPPVRRMVILSRVEETVVFAGRRFELACNEYPQTIHPQGHRLLKAFDLQPCPRWAYQGDGWTVEKQLRLLPGRNAALLTYTLWGGSGVGSLELRPLLALRPMHELMFQWNGPLHVERMPGQSAFDGRYRVPATSRTPEVFFAHRGEWEAAQGVANWYLNTIYRWEQERGYAGLEDLWCPGIVHLRLSPGVATHFVCATDPISMEEVLAEERAKNAESEQNEKALGKLFSTPAGRARVRASANVEIDSEIATLIGAAEAFAVAPGFPPGNIPVLSDYHWGASSPRNVLIGFSGRYLATGRFEQARALLLAMAKLIKDGLIPATLPEDATDPIYRAADVSLWFVNAVWNYLRYTGDQTTVQHALIGPVLSIIEHYRQGTAFGVGLGEDGLLLSRVAASATTWMDAKLGDWVITPRAGAAVEINALWYNALRIASALMELPGTAKPPEALSALAGKCCETFNRRFWNSDAECCYDFVDDKSADRAIRPNQLLAISLPFPILRADHHAAVLERVRSALLTPIGLRTLAESDPGYQGYYQGSVVSRERALHNGSVFPWLLGSYVSALVRVRGRNAAVLEEARSALRPCVERIAGPGCGHLCELFDGNAPHAPGGAVSASLGIAELLRCYVEDILDQQPAMVATGDPLEQFERSA